MGKEENQSFYNKLIKLALPIALQNLMLALVAVADALMLGNIEQNAMSAVSLATQVQFIQNMIFGGIVGSASILGAQYWGKGDKKTLQDIFNISLRLTLVVSFAFFALCELCPEFLMGIFTNEAVLSKIGVKYLKIAGWSYLLTGVSQSYHTILKVSEHVKETAIISVGTVLLNIILNALFIFGLFGIPRMEAEGAALSTLIARVIELIVCITISLGKNYIRPDLSRFFVHDKLLFSDYSKCMLPLLGASLVWGIGFTSYTAFMGHLGTDAAAANSVAAVVRDCVCCVCDGLAIGGGIMVGNELGAGKLDKGKEYGDKIVGIGYIIGALSTVVMLILTPAIMHVVKLSAQASVYLKGMMVIMSVYMIGRAVNSIVINGILAAGGDTMFDMYSLAVMMWGIAVPLAALGTFVLGWNPLVVYACTCLDEVGKIPWVMIHYKKYKWVKDLTR